VGAIHECPTDLQRQVLQGLEDKPLASAILYSLSLRVWPRKEPHRPPEPPGFGILLADQYSFCFLRPPRDSRDTAENQGPFDEPATVQPKPRATLTRAKDQALRSMAFTKTPRDPLGPAGIWIVPISLARLQAGRVSGSGSGFL